MSDGALLCVTLAPAVDRTAHVPRLEMDVVLRPTRLVALPGGKGVNAARAAARLGGRVITTGIAGGHAGRWIVEALTKEGLDPAWASAAAEARTTYVTVDGAGHSILVYERPNEVSRAEFESLLALLRDELLPRAARAIVAGSLPPGAGEDAVAAIVEVCRHARVPVLVDTAGPALVAALAATPDVVKIGRAEVVESGLAGADASSETAATALVGAGAGLAVVTDGADPVVAADARTIRRATVPQVEVVNAVGSGDAFGAAFSLALATGGSVEAALRRGVAAGSANALALGAGMLDAGIVAGLEPAVQVTTERR